MGPDNPNHAALTVRPADEDYDGWALLELAGQQRLAGHVRAVRWADSTWVRLDVPAADGPAQTRLLSPLEVVSLTPCTEEVARGVAASLKATPVARYDFPPRRPGERLSVMAEDDTDEADLAY